MSVNLGTWWWGYDTLSFGVSLRCTFTGSVVRVRNSVGSGPRFVHSVIRKSTRVGGGKVLRMVDSGVCDLRFCSTGTMWNRLKDGYFRYSYYFTIKIWRFTPSVYYMTLLLVLSVVFLSRTNDVMVAIIYFTSTPFSPGTKHFCIFECKKSCYTFREVVS